MPFLINKNSKGDYLAYEKHKSLIRDGAEVINNPTCKTDNMVCVINHGTQFVAYHIYSQKEYERVSAINIRYALKMWLKYKHAGDLSGFNDWIKSRT